MKFKVFNKYINLTCEESTFLISKKQETKLAWQENFRLYAHVAFCKPCSRFAKQVVIMEAAMTQFFNPNSSKSQAFSAKKKDELERLIKENK
jgi:hypothetical protein